MSLCTAIVLTLSVTSYYLSDDFIPTDLDRYNPINPGLSLECELNPIVQVEAGGYVNSINSFSVHTGIILKKDLNKDWRIGTNIGVVSGYETDTVVVPFVRPFVQYKILRVGFIPRYRLNDTDGSDAVITFELSGDISW